MVLVHSLVSFKASTSLSNGGKAKKTLLSDLFPRSIFSKKPFSLFLESSEESKAAANMKRKRNERCRLMSTEREMWKRCLGISWSTPLVLLRKTTSEATMEFRNRRRARPVNASNRHGDGRWHVTSPSLTGDRICSRFVFSN